MDKAVAECFYGCGLSFHLVTDPLFKAMLKAVGQYGPAYSPPNINQIREGLLDKAKAVIHLDQLHIVCKHSDYKMNHNVFFKHVI